MVGAESAAILRRTEGATLGRRRLTAAGRAVLRAPVVLFAVAYCVYAGVGLYTTLSLDLVVGDAQSRLADAYFALWNEPAKLAAIGFFWPPLQTIVLIPFAAIRPMATSLVGLPLSSALFAAGTVVVIERTLVLAGIGSLLRFAIVAAFGLNPFVLFYASNGMAESLYLFLLTAALAVFVRWTLAPRWHHLLHIGVLFALATLARYEASLWVPVVVLGVVLIYMSQRRKLATIEASVLVLGVPVAYAAAIWMYFNWSLIGDPLAFLRAGFGVAGPSSPVFTRGGSAGPSVFEQAANVLQLHFEIFPATYLIAGALLVFGVLRRKIAALALSAAVLLNAASGAAWALSGGGAAALHLRYNIRAIPIAVLASGWLLASLPRRARTPAAVVLVAALVASIPLTVRTMLHYRNAKGERAFIEGLRTGRSQDNVQHPAGTGIPIGQADMMAAYIRRHVHGTDAVLTDNAQTFGIMLADGHPERYLDRIDVSDGSWRRVRDDPVGHVRYFLIQRRVTTVALDRDLIVARYPRLVLGKRRPPFVRRLVFATPKYALFALFEKRVLWGETPQGEALRWYRKADLTRYLKAHGTRWRTWKARHPAAAAALAAQSR